jgi:hypothetical protein
MRARMPKVARVSVTFSTSAKVNADQAVEIVRTALEHFMHANPSLDLKTETLRVYHTAP